MKETHADGFAAGRSDGYQGKHTDSYVLGYVEGYESGKYSRERLYRLGEKARQDEMMEKDRAARREQINLEARRKMYKDETGTNL